MRLATLGALPPPQRKDLRGLPLARNQSHDAAAPELERDLNLFWTGGLFFAGAAPCGGRRCAKRSRACPGPAQRQSLGRRPS